MATRLGRGRLAARMFLLWHRRTIVDARGQSSRGLGARAVAASRGEGKLFRHRRPIDVALLRPGSRSPLVARARRGCSCARARERGPPGPQPRASARAAAAERRRPAAGIFRARTRLGRRPPRRSRAASARAPRVSEARARAALARTSSTIMASAPCREPRARVIAFVKDAPRLSRCRPRCDEAKRRRDNHVDADCAARDGARAGVEVKRRPPPADRPARRRSTRAVAPRNRRPSLERAPLSPASSWLRMSAPPQQHAADAVGEHGQPALRLQAVLNGAERSCVLARRAAALARCET